MKNKTMKIKGLILGGLCATLVACNTNKPMDEEPHTHNGTEHTHDHDASENTHSAEHDHTHEAVFSYLRMNGEFKMDPVDKSVRDDSRNPSRIVLSTTEEAGTLTKMEFYEHSTQSNLWASCGYEYIGSRPDPHYYPAQSKSSIWDVFMQKEAFEGDCPRFKYVISRSPHGEPIHMHLRYGQNVDELLAMSNMEEDSVNFNPWWSLYCDVNRNTSCAE